MEFVCLFVWLCDISVQGNTSEAEECDEPRGYIPTDAEKHLNSNMKFICIEISDVFIIKGLNVI